MSSGFTKGSWQSPDGLSLHLRDYQPLAADLTALGLGEAEMRARPPVVCMHGLTRNSRDFEDLAPFVASLGWRVLALDMRGRGKSDYAKDSASYGVPTYVGDVLALLDQYNIEQCVAIGTSMGGLMTMAMAAFAPQRLAGALLNDIGPEIELAGLEAIKGYVGQGRSFPTWMHAARALKEVQAANFPDFAIEDWLTMAKRGMVLHSNGRIAFDYDMKIAEPIMQADAAAVPPDMWPAYEALSGKPLLLVRGALSGLFSESTFAEMQRRIPAAKAVTIPNIGHAPTLDEPAVHAAITELLTQVSDNLS